MPELGGPYGPAGRNYHCRWWAGRFSHKLLLGEQVVQKYKIPKLYLSHHELAEDPAVDAVVVVTQEGSHAPVCIDLLNAGKHVLVEKPLTTNITDGTAMVNAAEQVGATLMVNFMRRYDPGVELGKRIISELAETGELGEITF